jgi:small nuclear ribonucleoprotein
MPVDKRPIDVLDQAKGKRIFITLKNGKEVSGLLQAMDMHLNMWLNDAEVIDGNEKTKFGKILLRGDNVIFASPEE